MLACVCACVQQDSCLPAFIPSFLSFFLPACLPACLPVCLVGLGNRFMGLVSVFVYSLLTNRAVVMPDDGVMPSFLCNPFPSSSWLIPAEHFW